MRARDCYRLIVRRGGLTPALLADPERLDRIELVEVDSGEAVLLWDLTPQEAAKLARELREDLSRMEGQEFMARWGTVER